uniref:hypothetical protein n=1 Tax=Enterocloster clostridioformis TaxID=1531 RepID=UPI000AC3F1F3|nr:hypothetical protein [Enterocloster clostridioformis]
MLSFLIVAAIAIAVIIGYKTGFNTGIFAIIFAYLIGCFGMGMSTKEVIGGWPVSTMFVIFSVSLFYNFALVNGTLEKSARYLLYMCRKAAVTSAEESPLKSRNHSQIFRRKTCT